MAKSQHREVKRKCPICLQEKLFPVRNETCSNECAREQRRRERAAPVGETRTESANDLTLGLSRTRVKTLDELIIACKIDTNTWECVEFVANKWEVAAVPRTTGNSDEGWKRESTQMMVEPLFQVKARFRRKLAIITVREEIAALKADAVKRAKPLRSIQHQRGDTMLELSIPDLHLGKLAWARETGWENYDSRIAQKVFRDATEALLARTAAHRFEEIVLVLGNDFLNSDNKTNTTTRGTPMTHGDTRYQRTFRDARLLSQWAIDRCREIAPVRVIMVSGNHDELSVWHLGDSLQCLYCKTPDITIDNEPTIRKYHRFGAVGIMWTHGDKGKHDDYPLIFARERRDIWAATRYQEVHCGHLHQTRVRERNGVRVRILPSLCAADAYHSENGYVGAERSAEAFVWDKEQGLIGTANYTVPPEAKAA